MYIHVWKILAKLIPASAGTFSDFKVLIIVCLLEWLVILCESIALNEHLAFWIAWHTMSFLIWDFPVRSGNKILPCRPTPGVFERHCAAHAATSLTHKGFPLLPQAAKRGKNMVQKHFVDLKSGAFLAAGPWAMGKTQFQIENIMSYASFKLKPPRYSYKSWNFQGAWQTYLFFSIWPVVDVWAPQ
jgi:hypothetical protein